ncbi:MAG: aminoacyl-tRNA hydrolase [Firmicutes bacterium]|nr:aminoacyl-tRNA hydrolase [Bacillota bacterium]
MGELIVKIIVGLGNPGSRYANTRHNMGFWVIDELSKQWNISVNKTRFEAIYGEGVVFSEKVILVKPQTFMNLSGSSVKQALNYFSQDVSSLLIVYDDLDLEPGVIRLKPSGSAGGHNGVKDIIQKLATQDFARLRIGIGASPSEMEAADYVLAKINESEQKVYQETVKRAVLAIETWIQFGIERAMNSYNQRT